MSFQATHLHFANQVKEIFNIQDFTRYFSGTLYPDSRYITKLERELTHNRIEPRKIFNLDDDFVKGWQIHLWYDKLALPHLDKIALGKSAKLLNMKDMAIWTKVSGAKLVEDFHWWEKTDWPQILPNLKYITNPNQEDPAVLKKWYQHFIAFYKNKPNLEDYRLQAAFMGIPKKRINLILIEANKIYNDKIKRAQTEQIMDQVILEFKNLI